MFPVRPASARRALQASSSSGRSGRGRSLLARANPPAVREREEALAVIAPFKRGQGATGPERKRILDKLERLEASNTTSALDIRDRISGNWVLLYQAPTKDLDELTDYEKKAVTVEGPFLSAFKPITKDLFKTLSNTQRIDVPNQCIDNIAEFRVANRVRGRLTISGQVVLGDPGEGNGDEESRKAYVTFSSFSIEVESKKILTLPVDKILGLLDKPLPRGWLLTTYIDPESADATECIRVGRGDKGSIFVAKRMR